MNTHTAPDNRWWNPNAAGWAPSAVTPLTDVRDMLVVHTALLREFRLAPAAVSRVPAGDLRRAAGVDRHLAFICDLLHHHHSGEDEMLWPKLRDRVPVSARGVLEAVEAQHAGIEAVLGRVATGRAAWVAGTPQTLVADLEELHASLVAHLDLEERSVLPLAAALLTAEEWDAVGEVAVAAMPKPALALAFGMFAYEGDPAVLRAMLRSAPAVPRLLLPAIAPRLYARRALQVHGTRRP